MAYDKVYPFGWVNDDGKWRRTAWEICIGVKRNAFYNGAKEPSGEWDKSYRKTLVHGLRIAGWPWFSMTYIQIFHNEKIIKQWQIYKKKKETLSSL